MLNALLCYVSQAINGMIPHILFSLFSHLPDIIDRLR